MIYFIQEKGLFRNRVKIGYTDNIRSRLRDLQSASPSKLKILLILSGDEQDEYIYHQRFARYRLHGEWFKFGFKLRLFVSFNQLKPIDIQSVMQTETIKKELSIKPPDYFAKMLDLNTQRNYDAEKAVVETWQSGSNFSACYRVWYQLTNNKEYDGTINGDKIRVIKQILSAWGIGGFDIN